MKSINDKTNPFSPCVGLEATNRPASPILSFAVNTAQKNHKSTTDLHKLGTLKNEETKPFEKGRISVEYQASQRLTSDRLSPARCGKYPHFFARTNQPPRQSCSSVGQKPCAFDIARSAKKCRNRRGFDLPDYYSWKGCVNCEKRTGRVGSKCRPRTGGGGRYKPPGHGRSADASG